MFRVEFFVDDRKLGPALTALVGLATGKPQVEPVVNMGADGRALSNGTVPEMFARYAAEHKLTDIRPKDIQNFAQAMGRSRNSYSNVLGQLMEAKLLRRGKKTPGAMGFTYHVTLPKAGA